MNENPKEQYAEQVAEEENDSLGEAALRDLGK